MSRVTSFGPTEPIDSTQHDPDTTTPLARTPSLLSRVSSFRFLDLNRAKEPSAGPPAVSDSSPFSFSGLNRAKEPSADPPAMSDSSSSGFSGLNQANEPSAGPPAVSDSSSFSFSGLNQAKDSSAGPPAMSDRSSFSFLGLNQAKEPSAGATAMSDSPSCMDQTNKEDLSLVENQEEKWEGESRSEVSLESSVGSEMTWFKSDKEVDAKADDFINKLKHQLKLQRLESLLCNRNSAN